MADEMNTDERAKFEAVWANRPTHGACTPIEGARDKALVEFGFRAGVASLSAAEPAANTENGMVPKGTLAHLKLMMEWSAFGGVLQLSDALANIDDFAAIPALQSASEAARSALETLERTHQSLRRQIDLIAERAPGAYLDKQPVVNTLNMHQKRTEAAAIALRSALDAAEPTLTQGAAIAAGADGNDALRCAVGSCAFNGEVAEHAPGCPSASHGQAPAQPTAVPLDEMAELSLLNRLIELGNKAAGANATANSDDGHKGTAAYVQWQEARAEMGELIRQAYAVAATAPQAAQRPDAGVVEDERENLLHCYWIMLGECESRADSDNDSVLRHQVEGFYRLWNKTTGQAHVPRWAARAAQQEPAQGGV